MLANQDRDQATNPTPAMKYATSNAGQDSGSNTPLRDDAQAQGKGGRRPTPIITGALDNVQSTGTDSPRNFYVGSEIMEQGVELKVSGGSKLAGRKGQRVPGQIETGSSSSDAFDEPRAPAPKVLVQAPLDETDFSPSMGDRSMAAFGSALKHIKDGLWIGDLGCMISREWQTANIRAIVTIMPSIPEEVLEVTSTSPGLRHFHYMLDDHIEYGDKDRHNLSTLFSDSPHKNIFDVLEFMHEARMEDLPVMVHCEQGKRRSATVMAAYLIWYLNLSRKDSIQLIQSKRRGATIPGIWRDELEFLAEKRAEIEESERAATPLHRVLSVPESRIQLEEEMKRKLKERRQARDHDDDLMSPSSAGVGVEQEWTPESSSPVFSPGGGVGRPSGKLASRSPNFALPPVAPEGA